MSDGYVRGSGTFQVIVELAFFGVEMRPGDYGCGYWIVDHHMSKGCHMCSHGYTYQVNQFPSS